MAHLSEPRQQAYLQLIQSLLTCPSGQAGKFFQTHQELLDAGLIQVMQQLAHTLVNEGKTEAAAFLNNMALQLAQALGISLIEPSEDQERFLLHLLQAITKYGADSPVIYPILQANMEQLDNRLVTLLQRLAQTMFQQADAAVKPHIADILSNLGKILENFPLGSHAVNLKISITAYQLALTIYTRETFPQKWEKLQKDLNHAYQEQIGDKKPICLKS
jgi:hypothetical protein